MSQTQSRLLEFHILELFVLQEFQEVLAETSHQFTHNSVGSRLNLQGLVDRTGQLVLADTQFGLTLLLHREGLREEVDEFLRSLARNGGADEGECLF